MPNFFSSAFLRFGPTPGMESSALWICALPADLAVERDRESVCLVADALHHDTAPPSLAEG